jgi:hypothetical protein
MVVLFSDIILVASVVNSFYIIFREPLFFNHFPNMFGGRIYCQCNIIIARFL